MFNNAGCQMEFLEGLDITNLLNSNSITFKYFIIRFMLKEPGVLTISEEILFGISKLFFQNNSECSPFSDFRIFYIYLPFVELFDNAS